MSELFSWFGSISWLGSILTSAAISTFIVYLFSDRRYRAQNTFSLHKEFSSGKMLSARILAERTLSRYINSRYNDFKDKLTIEERDNIWTVLHFYQRLFVLIDHNQVKKSLIPDLFGEIFIKWWYTPFFENSFVPLDWNSCKRIEKLNQFFLANMEDRAYKTARKNGLDHMKLLQSENLVDENEDQKSD